MKGEKEMTKQEKLNRTGRNYIAGLRQTLRVLWEKMCEEAGIPRDSKFVMGDVFQGSRYLPFYNAALNQLWEAEATYKVGGYVGLTIKGR